jgi:hypothetical protein
MDYIFRTQYFGLTDSSIFLLRGNYPYREISGREILRARITRGTDVKRPMISIVFGVLLIIAAAFLIYNYSEFDPNQLDRPRVAKAIGGIIVMEAMLFLVGSYLIYSAAPIHKVVELQLAIGTTVCLPTEGVKGEMNEFLSKALTEIVGHRKMNIDNL